MAYDKKWHDMASVKTKIIACNKAQQHKTQRTSPLSNKFHIKVNLQEPGQTLTNANKAKTVLKICSSKNIMQVII